MRILFRCAALILAAALLSSIATADTFTGTVTAGQTALVTTPSGGILTDWTGEIGQSVTAGEILGHVREARAFAPLDGTVVAIHAREGDFLSGTTVEIAPESLYTVYCTVKDYVKSAGSAVVHIGETVYLKCVRDGTHRAEGTVVDVDGANYTVETTAGELYVGEAVNVYLSASFDSELAGRGTVIGHSPVSVVGSGVMTRLRVAVGDRVWRGQWLFSSLDTDRAQAATGTVAAPVDGILVSAQAQRGASVQEGDPLAEIATSLRLHVEVSTEELSHFTPGQVCRYIRADDRHETRRSAIVTQILNPDGAETATIELVPLGDRDLPIGLTVRVEDGK